MDADILHHSNHS